MRPGSRRHGRPSADEAAVWGSVDYLLGGCAAISCRSWSRPARPAPRAAAGVLGQPATSVLVGGNTVNTGLRSGFQGELGYWFDPQRDFGIEAGFFILAGNTDSFPAGGTILARPFFDVTTGAHDLRAGRLPGRIVPARCWSPTRRIAFTAQTWTCAKTFCCGPWYRLDSLLGYRYLHYAQRLQIQQSSQPTGGAFAAGTAGPGDGQLRHPERLQWPGPRHAGPTSPMTPGPWTCSPRSPPDTWTATVDIEGNTLVSVPGAAAVSTPGGLLALSSNSGSHTTARLDCRAGARGHHRLAGHRGHSPQRRLFGPVVV